MLTGSGEDSPAPLCHCEPDRAWCSNLPQEREPSTQACIPQKREIASGAARPPNHRRLHASYPAGRHCASGCASLPQRGTARGGAVRTHPLVQKFCKNVTVSAFSVCYDELIVPVVRPGVLDGKQSALAGLMLPATNAAHRMGHRIWHGIDGDKF